MTLKEIISFFEYVCPYPPGVSKELSDALHEILLMPDAARRIASLPVIEEDLTLITLEHILPPEECYTLLDTILKEGTVKALQYILKVLLLTDSFHFSEEQLNALLATNSDKNKNRLFNKKMSLLYAACWDFFVGETPSIENMHRFPSQFFVHQPVDSIRALLNISAAEENSLSYLWTFLWNRIEKKDFADRNKNFTSGIPADIGFCIALDYLHDYYHSQGREEYYYIVIALFHIWLKSKETIPLDTPLPALLPQQVFHEKLSGLFRTWRDLILLIHGRSRKELFLSNSRLISISPDHLQSYIFSVISADTQLKSIGYLNQPLNDLQFDEQLKYFSRLPFAYIAITKNGHRTSISTHTHEECSFFDSRMPHAYFYDSIDTPSLKEVIHNTHEPIAGIENRQFLFAYYFQNANRQSLWQDSAIFNEDEFPKAKEDAISFQEKSPSQWTHLHIAVMMQDSQTVRRIVNDGFVAIEAKDAWSKTSLDIAIETGYTEGVDIFLQQADSPSYTLTTKSLVQLLKRREEDHIIKLLHNKKIHYNLADVVAYAVIYNNHSIIETILHAVEHDPLSIGPALLVSIDLLFKWGEERRATELFEQLIRIVETKVRIDDFLNTCIVGVNMPIVAIAALRNNIIFLEKLFAYHIQLDNPLQNKDYTDETPRDILVKQRLQSTIPFLEHTLFNCLENIYYSTSSFWSASSVSSKQKSLSIDTAHYRLVKAG